MTVVVAAAPRLAVPVLEPLIPRGGDGGTAFAVAVTWVVRAIEPPIHRSGRPLRRLVCCRPAPPPRRRRRRHRPRRRHSRCGGVERLLHQRQWLGLLARPLSRRFPSSIFQSDKNRCGMGKSQPKWTAKDGNAWRPPARGPCTRCAGGRGSGRGSPPRTCAGAPTLNISGEPEQAWHR
jgi:hypothetical protein